MAPRLGQPVGTVERNIELVGQITQYLLDHPEVLESLPADFELVVLPEDDPDIRLYNLELLDQIDADKPVVFARLRTKSSKGRARITPSLFVPIPSAAP